MKIYSVLLTMILGMSLEMSPTHAGDWQVGSGKQKPPRGLAENMAKQLKSQASTITLDRRNYCTFWFCESVAAPVNKTQIANGLLASDLPEGSFLGVIELHQEFIDYRKQQIAPGVYTLRLARQPDTGDHMETAPHKDFLLLVPSKDDRDPEPIELLKLIKKSMKATNEDHPGVMLLYPGPKKQIKEQIRQDKNHVYFESSWTIAATSGDVSFGATIVIQGYSATRK